MLNWTTEINPDPGQRYTLRHDGITLQILPRCTDSPGHCYTHCIITLGRLSEASESEELRTWPREALKLARRLLNDYEKALEEE